MFLFVETVHKLVAESSSSQDTVLDLSTKMKEDTNNNAIKTQKSNFLRNRKYSELSDCSNVSDSVQQVRPQRVSWFYQGLWLGIW